MTSQSFAFHSKVIWSEVKKVMDTMKILTDESFLYEDNVQNLANCSRKKKQKRYCKSNVALYLVIYYCLVQAARSAMLRSPLSVDSLFANSDQPLRLSLGFRSSSSDGTVLRSSHQVASLCKSQGCHQKKSKKSLKK